MDGYDLIKWYYREAYQKHYEVSDPQYVGWYDKDHQIKRFEAIMQAGITNKQVILDYGCGIGDFAEFLANNGIKLTYYGLDINEEYVRIATELHPDLTFYVGDVTDISSESLKVDWVVASGTFNVLVPKEWMLLRLKACKNLVKRGIVFNLLTKSEDPNQLIPYNENNVREMLFKDFPEFNVQIIKGYLDDDMTIILTKHIIDLV